MNVSEYKESGIDMHIMKILDEDKVLKTGCLREKHEQGGVLSISSAGKKIYHIFITMIKM